jgi:hypothetical protein
MIPIGADSYYTQTILVFEILFESSGMVGFLMPIPWFLSYWLILNWLIVLMCGTTL